MMDMTAFAVETMTQGVLERADETNAAAGAPSAEPGSPVAAVPRQSPWPSWPVLAGATWLLGTTLFLLPVFAGLAEVRSLRRSARPWPHGRTLGFLVIEHVERPSPNSGPAIVRGR